MAICENQLSKSTKDMRFSVITFQFRIGDIRIMEDIEIGRWLKNAMKLRDVTQIQLADRLGLRQNQISQMGRGERKISATEAIQIARILKVQLPGEETGLRVMGYVGAGAEVIPIDDGDPLAVVEVDFPVPRGSVAAIIRGDSMYPIFEDGDLVAYGGEPMPPERAIGATCVVQITDGRMLIKKVQRGTRMGLYTLTSANAPDIEDVTLEWARAFVLRISRDYWRRAKR
jgi:transcriptional regulator with XRE-family HTH domain